MAILVGDYLSPEESEKRRKAILRALQGSSAPLDTFKSRQEDIYPYEGKLEIRYDVDAKGVKIYSIVCGPCGEKRLEIWDGGNGLRCAQCFTFHGYLGYMALQERIHKLHRMNDGKVLRIPQRKRKGANVRITRDKITGKILFLKKI